MSRREYRICVFINDLKLNKVIIDSHYEEKHASSVNDEIIVELVKTLDGFEYEPDHVDGSFSYFVNDRIEYKGKFYRLIWLLEEGQIYIGVVNAYRR